MAGGNKIGEVYVEIGAISQAFNKAIAEAKTKTTGLNADFRSTTTAAGNLNNQMGSLSSGIMKYVGPIATVTGALAALRGIYTGLIQPAMNAQEATSKFDTIFASQAASVREWATTLGTAIGRSSRELQGMAADMMAVMSAMVPTRAEAVRMSEGLVQMAQDLSSFHNTDVTEALAALRSAMTGETEPMKRYGIVLTDTALQEYALSQGMRKRVEQMSTSEKTQLRYNMVLARMGAASGDAERTSGSLTNKLRALDSAINDGAVAIGEKMVPGMTSLVTAMTDSVRNGGSMADTMKELASDMNTVLQFTANLVSAFNGSNKQTQETTSIWKDLAQYAIAPVSALWDYSVKALDMLNNAMRKTPTEELASKQQQLNTVTQDLIRRHGSLEAALRVTGDVGVAQYQRLREEAATLARSLDAAPRAVLGGLADVATAFQRAGRNEATAATQRATASANQAALEQKRAKAVQDVSQVIQAAYGDERTAAEQEYSQTTELMRKNLNDRLISQGQYDSAVLAASQIRSEKMKEILKKEREAMISNVASVVSTVGSFVGQASQLYSQYTSNRTTAIDNEKTAQLSSLTEQYDAEVAAVNNSVMTKTEKTAALKALDEKLAREEKAINEKAAKDKLKIEREAAKRQKVLSIFETLLATPQAAMQAYKAMAGIPVVGPALGIAAAAAATALGLAKLAIIQQTPLPEAAEGIYAETPYIGGEAGPELAFPLSSERGRKAMQMFANDLTTEMSSNQQQATIVNSGSSGNMFHVIVNVAGKTFFDEITRASENGEIIINARAIVGA
jgi:hypothetical protein